MRWKEQPYRDLVAFECCGALARIILDLWVSVQDPSTFDFLAEASCIPSGMRMEFVSNMHFEELLWDVFPLTWELLIVELFGWIWRKHDDEVDREASTNNYYLSGEAWLKYLEAFYLWVYICDKEPSWSVFHVYIIPWVFWPSTLGTLPLYLMKARCKESLLNVYPSYWVS